MRTSRLQVSTQRTKVSSSHKNLSRMRDIPARFSSNSLRNTEASVGSSSCDPAEIANIEAFIATQRFENPTCRSTSDLIEGKIWKSCGY